MNFLRKFNWRDISMFLGYFDLAYGIALGGGGIVLDSNSKLIMGIIDMFLGAYLLTITKE